MKFKQEDIEIKKIILSGFQSSYLLSDGIKAILLNIFLIQDAVPSEHFVFNIAAEYIIAYLDLGLGYLEHQSLFDYTLSQAGFTCEEIALLQARNPLVPLTRPQLRAVMGRWPASPHNSHTIVRAIDDIIHHVRCREQGTYLYYTAKKDGSYTALYRLTVTPQASILHNVFQNKYYRLAEE